MIARTPRNSELEAVEQIVESVSLQSVVVGEHEHVDENDRDPDALHVGGNALPDRYVSRLEVLAQRQLEIHARHAN